MNKLDNGFNIEVVRKNNEIFRVVVSSDKSPNFPCWSFWGFVNPKMTDDEIICIYNKNLDIFDLK